MSNHNYNTHIDGKTSEYGERYTVEAIWNKDDNKETVEFRAGNSGFIVMNTDIEDLIKFIDKVKLLREHE